MAFTGRTITLVGLLKLKLPGRTVRLCDGGFCDFANERYTAQDAVFGTIGGIDPVQEGIGDLAPGGSLSFLPAPGAAPSALSSPLHQNSRLQGWLGEIGADGFTVMAARSLFDGLVDVPTLKLARGTIAVAMTFMARAEKLFSLNEGNTLSPRFHKAVWPGEAGLDNATGVATTVAWGTESPPRGVSYGGGAGGGGGGGLFNYAQLAQQ